MKQVLLLISIVLLFFTVNTNAQLKPAQSQYLVEKGVLINPSFEQGYKGWVITGCTKSLVSETPYLNKSLKLTCTNETFSIKQVSTALTSFSKQQGAFDLQIKTTASGVNVSSITNGVRDNVYSVINSTEFKRFKEIGFIVGDTDNGIEVYSDTNFTGEIILDNVKLGLGNLTQDIGAAHFVGSIIYDNIPNCLWQRTSGSWGDFPIDNDCIAHETVGEVLSPDTSIPAFGLIPRTDGYYKVTMQGVYQTNGAAWLALSSTNGKDAGQPTSFVETTSNTNNNLAGNFRFTDTSKKNIRIVSNHNSGTLVLFANSANDTVRFDVHFFPDSKSTIATQSTTLTAKTANSFSTAFDGSVSGTPVTVLTEDYAGVITCSSIGTGNWNCLINTPLTVIPSFNCTVTDSAVGSRMCAIRNKTTTSFSVNITRSDTATVENRDFDVTIRKQGADVNKDATIIGKFEQIRSDDLVVEKRFMAIDYSSSVIDVSSLRIENLDTNKYYDITLNLVTIFGSNSTCTLQAYDNGNLIGQNKVAQSSSSTPEDRISQSFVIPSYKPTTSTITFNLSEQGACTFEGQGDLRQTYVVAAEQATKESIVANLMQGQTKVCQEKKFLSANTSSIGVLADLTTDNLIVGRVYSFNLQHYGVANSVTNVVHDGVVLAQAYIASSQGQNHPSSYFKAKNNTLTVEKSNSIVTIGNGTGVATWMQVCLEPETTILE